jgi:hypothetical protein
MDKMPRLFVLRRLAAEFGREADKLAELLLFSSFNDDLVVIVFEIRVFKIQVNSWTSGISKADFIVVVLLINSLRDLHCWAKQLVAVDANFG